MSSLEYKLYKSAFSCVLLLQLVREHRTQSASPRTTLLTWILRSPSIEKIFYYASAYKTFKSIICAVYTVHLQYIFLEDSSLFSQ